MADIKLVYFDIRGFAEPSRMILAAAGQKFDDVRITREELPKHKAESPFGQLPYLVYKGQKYGQSNAIAAFLAREFGFHGKTNQETARIEEVVGLCGDIQQCTAKAFFEQDPAKKAEIEAKLKSEDLPRHLGNLEKVLVANGSSDFFVGNSVTLADFLLFNLTDSLLKWNADVLVLCPAIVKMRQAVAQQPKIKAYLAARKDTDL